MSLTKPNGIFNFRVRQNCSHYATGTVCVVFELQSKAAVDDKYMYCFFYRVLMPPCQSINLIMVRLFWSEQERTAQLGGPIKQSFHQCSSKSKRIPSQDIWLNLRDRCFCCGLDEFYLPSQWI